MYARKKEEPHHHLFSTAHVQSRAEITGRLHTPWQKINFPALQSHLIQFHNYVKYPPSRPFVNALLRQTSQLCTHLQNVLCSLSFSTWQDTFTRGQLLPMSCSDLWKAASGCWNRSPFLASQSKFTLFVIGGLTNRKSWQAEIFMLLHLLLPAANTVITPLMDRVPLSDDICWAVLCT